VVTAHFSATVSATAAASRGSGGFEGLYKEKRRREKHRRENICYDYFSMKVKE